MATLSSFVALALLFSVQVARTFSSEVSTLIAVHLCMSWRSGHVKRLALWERSNGGATVRWATPRLLRGSGATTNCSPTWRDLQRLQSRVQGTGRQSPCLLSSG